MAEIQVKLDPKTFGTEMKVFAAQIPFATAKAVNYATIEGQKAVRAHMKEAFTIRRESWVLNAVKIKPFANKQTLTATIQILPAGGEARDVLSAHEDWQTKKPRSGKTVAIPLQAVRPDEKKVIPTSKRPRNLKNAFKMKAESGETFLMVRKGRGKTAQMVPAYRLEPQVKVKPRLAFVETVTKAVEANWQTSFDRAWSEAVATALK